jgi:hypothetical protein
MNLPSQSSCNNREADLIIDRSREPILWVRVLGVRLLGVRVLGVRVLGVRLLGGKSFRGKGLVIIERQILS